MTTLLATKNLSIQFGGIKAVTNLNLEVEKQSITALIGPNGAGKTTVFNMITGVYQPTSGEIIFKDQPIHTLKSYEIARSGISRTFQNIRLFKNLTVLDNVRIGLDISNTKGLWQAVLQTDDFKRQEKTHHAKALEWLKIFDLQDRAFELAKNLSYGDQRRVEIARALATEVQLLLLDEPAAGLNNQETDALMKVIQKIRNDFGITILLIEHDMKLVMGISEKITVLDYGIKIAEGSPSEIKKNPQVIEAYLGKPAQGEV